MGEATEPSDAEVIDAAVDAAEAVIFSRLDRAEIVDMDIGITYDTGELSIDIYLHAPDARVDVDQVARDAGLAARSAVDDLHTQD